MNIDYLKTVKAAAELENYQIVSERLSCAVSTVSYQIRKVEEDMGIQIFERAGRNIRLTQQGIRALHLIGNILDSLDALSSLQDPFSVKQLKIAVAEPIFLHRICPKLSYLESLFPNTELSFIIRNCGDVKTHVLSGMSDIGIHFAFDNYDESMNTHILGTCPLIFVGSPEFYLRIRCRSCKNMCGQRGRRCLCAPYRSGAGTGIRCPD